MPSKTSELKNFFSHSLQVISKEGFSAFLLQAFDKIRKGEFRIKESFSENKIKKTIDLEKIKSECEQFEFKPKISIITPVYKSNIDWLQKAIDSVRSQAYQNWELCLCDDGSNNEELNKFLKNFENEDERIKVSSLLTNQGVSSASNKALKTSSGEFVLFLDHDDEIAADALYEIVKKLNEDKNIDIFYSDEAKINDDGNYVEPFFKPDYSLHLLRSKNYMVHFYAIRSTLVKQVGDFDSNFDNAQDYDFILRVLEKTEKVFHIDKILYFWRKSAHSGAQNPLAKPETYEKGRSILQNHLNRLGVDCSTEIISPGHYRVRYSIDDTPNVDILISTRKISFIKKCVKSIRTKTTWKNYRIWALVNGKNDYEVIEIKSLDCTELHEITDEKSGLIGPSMPYNWSRMNNIGASKTNAPYIIFLNDDTEIITNNWIEEMLQYAQQKDIGVVGVMLMYPDDVIQHAGDYITENGMGSHCFNKMDANSNEVYGLAQLVRETSAVTSACFMVQRAKFNELNGYDENLRNFDDYDFCLRIREKGYKIIYNPFVRVYHYESPTRPHIHDEKLKTHLLSKHSWAKSDPFFRYEWRNLYHKISNEK